ncbi:MAG: hypothetical protein KJO39_11560 [Bacteroidia bacterium]|nr:hypothetical protein [Bacteroidia bacterium]NNF31718.1 hypothetical protein [Flavobacteriaceae bacterium]NNJ81121.1 hypothetical protein [Flavobacteriaceae bacterium]NNK55232.1 hypothetical protein [Flavobacteriaceae bacterium]NNM10227.1 hypothetical protein [Flavobacteriaceae bacterium]
MKKAIIILGCVIGAMAFISADKNDPANNNSLSLEGVWELEHQFLYEDNEVKDTIMNLNGYRQVKVYTKGKVMWTRFNPADSNEWFGYGSYEVKDGMLEEQLEYASDAMMRIVDTVQVFRFELDLGKERYSQIVRDSNGDLESSENYIRIE